MFLKKFFNRLIRTVKAKQLYQPPINHKCFLWFEHSYKNGEDNQPRCKRCGEHKIKCLTGGKKWTKC